MWPPQPRGEEAGDDDELDGDLELHGAGVSRGGGSAALHRHQDHA